MASYTGLYFHLILSLLLAYCLNSPNSLSLFMPMFLSPCFYILPLEPFSARGQGLGFTGSLMCLQCSAIIWKSRHHDNTKSNSPIWAISGFNPTAREEALDVCFLCTSIWILSVPMGSAEWWRNQSDPEWFPLCPSWFPPTSPSRPGRCAWLPGDVQDAWK